ARSGALHIPVYEQQVLRLAEIPLSVRRLGTLAGTEPQAGRAAHDIETRLAALKATYAAAASGRPSVLLQVWNRPIYTVGGRHLMSDALEGCGARHVFADLPGASPEGDPEAGLTRQPETILDAHTPREG